MIRVRVEKPVEVSRLIIAHPARDEGVLTRDNREKKTGIGRVMTIVDARQKPADLIRVEQGPLVNGLAPAIGMGSRR